MTVHIASSDSAGNAVIFADSQASTKSSEFHGVQKLFVGEDFIVGCAGTVVIIEALFQRLQSTPNVTASNVTTMIEQFVDQQVSYAYRSQIAILALTPSAGNPAIQQWMPEVFNHFGSRVTWATIGSGSEFVDQARTRERKIGIERSSVTLHDMLVMIDDYAESANESLTVDDQHLVGFLRNDKAYIFGHLSISPQYSRVPQLLDQAIWTRASSEFDIVRAMISPIKSSLLVAQTALSPIQTGTFVSSVRVPDLEACNSAIATHRAQLEAQLDAFCAWYDTSVRP
jgi:hypothetical protein